MATPIRIKRSAVSGKRPQLTDLQVGELALNTYDGSLFTERDTGGVGIATTVSNLTPWTESYGASSISYLNSVGIGTTNPTNQLHITGADPQIKIQDSANGHHAQIFLDGPNSNLNFDWVSSGDRKINFINSGTHEGPGSLRVGIGTTNPVAKLDVAGKILAGDSITHPNLSNTLDTSAISGVTAFRPINLIDTSSLIKLARLHDDFGPGLDLLSWDANLTTLRGRSLISLEDGDLKVMMRDGSSTLEKLRITSTGNVGIGSTIPVAKLDVGGNAVVSGGLQGAVVTSTSHMFANASLTVQDDINARGNIIGDDVTNISGINNLTVSGISTFEGDAHFDGNVSVGGTLTYEDVTNIDSVGIVTARKDVHVGAGLSVVGISTFNDNVRIGDNASFTANSNGDNLVIGSLSGNHGVTILSNNTASNNAASLFFGDSGSPIAGAIRYFHASNYMMFRVAGGERVRITGTGRVGINSTSPSHRLEVVGDSLLKGDLNITGISTHVGFSTFKDGIFVAGVSTFSDDINVDSGKTLTLNSDASNPVIKIQGSGPNFITFATDAPGNVNADSINLVYRTTPNTLGFERASDNTIFFTVDADDGLVTVNNNLNVVSDLDVDGTANLDDVDIDGNLSVSGIATIGTGVTVLTDGNVIVSERVTCKNLLASSDGNTTISILDTGHGFSASTIGLSNGGRDLSISAPRDIRLKPSSGLNGIVIENNGAVELYHANNKKFETSAKGIKVGTGVTIETNGQAIFTGIVTATGADINGDLNVSGVSTFVDDIFVGVGATVGFGNTAYFNHTAIIDGSLTVGNAAAITGGAPTDQGNLAVYGGGRNSLIIQTNNNSFDRGIAFRNNGDFYVAHISATNAGSNTADLVFGVESGQSDVSTISERMRITKEGNVGINSTAPIAKLDVDGSFHVSDNIGIGTTTPTELLHLAADSAHQILLKRGGASPSEVTFGNEGNTARISNNTNGIDLRTGLTPSSSMLINRDGDVGIGTDDPQALLDVSSDSPNFRITDLNSSAGAGNTSYTQLANINGNTYVYTRANENNGSYLIGGHGDGVFDEFIRIRSNGNVGIGTNNSGAKLEVFGTDAGITVHNHGESRGGIAAFENQKLAFVSTHVNDDLVFGYSNNPPSTANFVERMRIDNGTGNVGIGTNNPNGVDALAGNTATLAVGILTANTIYGNVVGGLSPTGNIFIGGDLDVDGDADLDVLNVSDTATFTANINANGNIVGDNATAITGISRISGQGPAAMAVQNVQYVGRSNDPYGFSFLNFNDQNVPPFGDGGNFTTLASISGLNLIYDTNDNDNNGFVVGVGSTNVSDANAFTAHMVIDHTGEVGFGTNNPESKLHISGTGANEIRIDTNATGLSFHNYSEFIGFMGNASGNLFINAGGTQDTLSLQTGGTEALQINNSQDIILKKASIGAIHRSDTSGAVYIAAGSDTDVGGNINLFGSTHATLANHIRLRNGATVALEIDANSNATFAGNVSIAGTLTYEDVTNIDSIGIITARNGIHVTGAGVSVAGISKFIDDVEFQGKVGIGTTDPKHEIHIQDNTPTIRFTKTNGATDNKHWNIGAGTHQILRIQGIKDAGGGGGTYFEFYRDGNQVTEFRGSKSGNPWFVVDNHNRRVGIGSTTPTEQLDVVGNTKLQNNVDIDGNLIGNGNVGFGTITNSDVRLKVVHDGLDKVIQQWGGYQGSGASHRFLNLYSPANDVNTDYFRFQTGNALKFQVDSIDAISINSDGKVGIGTDSVDAKLHVENGKVWIDNDSGDNTTRANGLTVSHTYGTDWSPGTDPGDSRRIASFITKGATKSSIISLRNLDDSNAFFDFIADGTTDKFYVQGNAARAAGLGPAITLNTSNRVGIGTENPTAHLQVYRKTQFAGNPIIQARSNNGSTNELKFEIDGDGDAYFNGNVGIASTIPNTRLDVIASSASRTWTPGTSVVSMFERNGNSRIAIVANASAYSEIDFGDSNDDNVGYIRYDHIDDSMSFRTDTDEQLRITSTGNVGIGTSIPDAKLNVYRNDAGIGHQIQISQDGTGDATLGFEIVGTRAWSMGIDNDDSDKFKIANGPAVAGSSESNTRLTIQTDGKIGIGTSNPLQKLNVHNDTPSNTGGILVQNVSYAGGVDKPYLIVGTKDWTGATTNWNTFGFQHRIKSTNPDGVPRVTIDGVNGEYFCVDNGGKVGIGTEMPQSALEVSGSAAVLTITDTRNQTFSVGDVLSSLAFDTNDSSGGVSTSIHPRAKINLVTENIFGSATGISFETKGDNTSAPSERLRITSTGDVGIGSAIPAEKLDVAGHIKVDGGPVLETSATYNPGKALRITSPSGFVEVGAQNTSYAHFITDRGRFYFGSKIIVDQGIVGSYNEDLVLMTNIDDERIRIKNDDGNVGIGTNDPKSELHVESAIGTATTVIISQQKTYGVGTGTAERARLDLALREHHQTANNRVFGRMEVGTNSETDSSHGFLAFSVRQSGSVSEKLRIKNNGNVGIGTINPGELLVAYKTSNDAQIKVRTTTAGAYFEADSAHSSGFYGIKLSSVGTQKWFLGSYSSANFQIKDGSAASGDERFTIQDGTGNIGIGTNDPDAKLNVNVGSSVTAFNVSGSEGQLFSVTNNLSSGSIFSVNDISGSPSIDVDADGTIQLAPLLPDEKVGIGTTNPASKLHVFGNVVVGHGNTHTPSGLGTGAGVGIVTCDVIHLRGGGFVAPVPLNGGNQVVNDAAIVVPENFHIYNLESDGKYFRNLLEKNSNIITLGQDATNTISKIRIKPGNLKNGNVELYNDDNIILSTSDTGVNVTGILTATSFVKTGGTSSQFLMADGSTSTGGGGATDKIEEGNTSAEVVDTGSDGHFKVTTEGTERLRVTDNGAVKIGTGITMDATTGIITATQYSGGIYAKFRGPAGNTANINTATGTIMEWMRDDGITMFNKGGFTNTTEYVTVPVDGLYQVTLNGRLECSNGFRSNVRFNFSQKLSETSSAEYTESSALNNYIRVATGHNESSVNLTCFMELEAGDQIGVRTLREADSVGTVTLNKLESSITFIKVA